MGVAKQGKKVAFIGAGAMGYGMASQIMSEGYDLACIANKNRAPIDALLRRGATEAKTFAELIDGRSVIILCLPNSDVVKTVISQLSPHLQPDMSVIDMGTSKPSASKEIDGKLRKIMVDFLEAPVTGGVAQARSGDLGALVGGSESLLEEMMPILKTMCRTIQYFGPVGSGNTAKLLNNYIVLGMVSLIIEAFNGAKKADIEWEKLYSVVKCGSADSMALDRIIGNAVQGDFDGYVFSIENALKDADYIHELARSLDIDSSLPQVIQRFFSNAMKSGDPEANISQLLKH